MKYLKLKTEEPLPPANVTDATGIPKPSHITFAYFGEIKVNEVFISTVLSDLQPFVLKKVREDKFGKNKDIPVVIYEITDKTVESKIHYARLQILQAYNLLDSNFANWTPHVSNVDFSDAPELLHVTSIQSNDCVHTFDLSS